MKEASELPQRSIVDIDPEDPAQLLDDAGQFSVISEYEVEAQPHAEAEAELDAAVTVTSGEEPEEGGAVALDTPLPADEAYADTAHGDAGDLYGVRTPHAADRDLEKTEDREAFLDSEAGEHWLETLGKKAAEYGVEPEERLDVVDDSDEHPDHRGHHSTDTRDRPVADRGAGGKAGM